MDYFNIDRFLSAQDSYESYTKALQEVKDGRKHSHWIWYVFPQISGLGHSDMACMFGISSLLEAKAYLENAKLKNRLYEITRALYMHNGNLSPEEIFGSLDAMKVRSCMTLFDIVSPGDIFNDVLRDCYHDSKCEKTIQMTAAELSGYRENDPLRRYHINGKALLEIGSFESEGLSLDQKIGTLIDLSERGYTATQVTKSYLFDTDMSYYRTSDIETTLSCYLSSLCRCASHNTDNEELKSVLRRIAGRDDEDHDLFEYARRLDNMIYEIRHIAAIEKLVNELKSHTIITDTQC